MSQLAWALLFALIPVSAHASQDLASYLESTIAPVQAAVDACEAIQVPGEEWRFSSFRVSLEPHASFGIPGVAGVTITPRVELIWERAE